MSPATTTVLCAVLFYSAMVSLIELIEARRAPALVVIPALHRNTRYVAREDRISWDVAWAVLLVGAATGVAFALTPDVFAPEDVVMLYVAAIMVGALRFGRAAAVVAAALSVAAFDFFFVPPLYTFFVASPRHLLTFAMMFAVGISISTLARRLKRTSVDNALKKRSEEVKTALLSTVSHDLRTPLAAITGAATTLRDNHARIPEAERHALLETIADEGFHLERLVAGLLDMTRVESGALKLKREWIPVDELLGSALARTEARLGARTVHTSVGDDVPLMHVDTTLFEQALVNIFDNAAKHTPADSNIDVTARRRDDVVDLVIADDGPGVPGDIDVFERFARGKSAQGGGVGLGLAIARGIVEAHGGELVLEPRERGAAFRVTLKAGDPPRVPEAP